MTRVPYQRGGSSSDHRRGWDGDRDHDRDHQRRRSDWGWGGYGYGYPYYYPGAIFTGYVDPWLFGPDDYGYDNSNGYAANDGYGGYSGYGNDVPAPYRNYGQQPDDSGNPYPPEYRQQPYPSDDENQQPPPQRPSSGRPAYNGQGVTQGMSEPAREDAVTVIFKDGRPAEQIHNYLLTSTTLTVLDAHRQQIPLDDVNLEATVAANRAAGVDFRVPAARQ
jgi:hypothetical protein